MVRPPIASPEEARQLVDQINEALADYKAARASAIAAGWTEPEVGRATPEHVYFIRGTRSGLIKIGCASDPMGRLASLQTGSPEPLELVSVWRGGGRGGERELHEALAPFRSHGEWFYPSDEVLAAVRSGEPA